ncbi:hypothetical protein VTH82DRAFT_7471 [Thermothelomyces myriococcoides]
MADPAHFRYMDPAGRRSPPLYNPARASMPVTGGSYGPLYSGDLHTMSASHHEGVPRPADEYRTSTVPVSTTSYAVRKEPVPRNTSVNDGARAQRVYDPGAKRPIIVTTKHQPTAPARSGSPTRDSYRSGEEGHYYTQPASSIPRSRAAGHIPSSVTMDEEEYRRLKERTHQDRLAGRGADPYRSPPSGPLYAGPSYRTSSFEYDQEGYEYTKPSDLARYDLDHDNRRRIRRHSVDRYYRPTVSISTDLARPFEHPERRARGPPPATKGLEKIGWSPAASGIYDGAGSHMPLPPAAPIGPEARHSSLADPPMSPREDHRSVPRPLPLTEDDLRHPHDDYYYEDSHDHPYFRDDRVATRGFGILIEPNVTDDYHRRPDRVYHDDRPERRATRYEVREPRRRSDDDMEIVRHGYGDRDYRAPHEERYTIVDDRQRVRRDRRSDDEEEGGRGGGGRRGGGNDDDDNDPSSKKDNKVRDKAAASAGLKSALKRRDEKVEDSPPTRKHGDEDAGRRERDEVGPRDRAGRKDHLLGDEEFEIVEHPKDREQERKPEEEPKAETRESKKDDDIAAAAAAPPPPGDRSTSVDDDEDKTKPRRRPRASSFNPNDTAALAEVKARLAELKVEDKDAQQQDDRTGDKKEPSAAKDGPPERKPSPVERREADADASALVPKDKTDDDKNPPPPREEKQVRLVMPPKETTVEKKPIKGILKQPRAQFPEDPNPVREGVAPHKDDKSKANVPPGARWTKISRKLVNPEALRIGKERFEVRDDFVIVLRVLSKEEIQSYTAATAALRGKIPA